MNSLAIYWEEVAQKKTCKEKSTRENRKWSVAECAASCKEKGPMFAYGTNDFGAADDRCVAGSGGCLCWCYPEVSADGTCTLQTNDGYRLYRFFKGTFFVRVIAIFNECNLGNGVCVCMCVCVYVCVGVCVGGVGGAQDKKIHMELVRRIPKDASAFIELHNLAQFILVTLILFG